MNELSLSGNQDSIVEITLDGEHFKLTASELLDALCLWRNTKKELEDDACVLLPEEQGKIHALFYISIEGGRWKRLKYPIYKEWFKSDSFVTIPHAEYSEVLGMEIQNDVLLVAETIPVFGLMFSDGSLYYHGKTKCFAPEIISQAELISLGKVIDG